MLIIENCNSLSDLRQKLIDGEEVRTARYEPCEDAIKREDALRAFMYATNGERLPDYDCDNYPVTYDLRCIKKTLRALPSVNPQAKTGHWIALEEWKKDFKEYVNSLSMLRDDYKGIMEYIDELPVTPQPKVGCEGCIYEKTGNNSTYPCSHCGRCYTDKYKTEGAIRDD